MDAREGVRGYLPAVDGMRVALMREDSQLLTGIAPDSYSTAQLAQECT